MFIAGTEIIQWHQLSYCIKQKLNRLTSLNSSIHDSSYWFLYRRGVITGTTAKRIVSQDLKSENNKKINKIISRFFP